MNKNKILKSKTVVVKCANKYVKMYVKVYVNTYQVTPVSLQEVLSVGTGTFMDETIPRANEVDIWVLWNIKQLS